LFKQQSTLQIRSDGFFLLFVDIQATRDPDSYQAVPYTTAKHCSRLHKRALKAGLSPNPHSLHESINSMFYHRL